MNQRSCTEAELQTQADQQHDGDLVKLHLEIEERIESTVWATGRAHLEGDLRTVKSMLRREMGLNVL